MKYGIYYAYWEKEWGGQFVPYVEKCRRLGFDILEVACGAFHLEEDGFFRELRQAASDNGILLTGGYGPLYGGEHRPAQLLPRCFYKLRHFYRSFHV